MSIEVPGSAEFFDFDDPIATAIAMQDKIFFLDDVKEKMVLAQRQIALLNTAWQWKDHQMIVGDYLVGPPPEDDIERPWGYYKQAAGQSIGFSALTGNLDIGENTYLALTIAEITTVQTNKFVFETKQRIFHAPVIGKPWYELLEAS